MRATRYLAVSGKGYRSAKDGEKATGSHRHPILLLLQLMLPSVSDAKVKAPFRSVTVVNARLVASSRRTRVAPGSVGREGRIRCQGEVTF